MAAQMAAYRKTAEDLSDCGCRMCGRRDPPQEQIRGGRVEHMGQGLLPMLNIIKHPESDRWLQSLDVTSKNAYTHIEASRDSKSRGIFRTQRSFLRSCGHRAAPDAEMYAARAHVVVDQRTGNGERPRHSAPATG